MRSSFGCWSLGRSSAVGWQAQARKERTDGSRDSTREDCRFMRMLGFEDAERMGAACVYELISGGSIATGFRNRGP